MSVSLALVGVAAVAIGAWCQGGLSRARALARHGLWAEAGAAVARYLVIHPRDAEANLLAAEAIAKDDSLVPGQRVRGAVGRLRRVRDASPQAGAARKAEARVRLFLGRDAIGAERAVEEALALDADDVEARTLAWKILDLTRRSEQVEPHFWRVLEGTPAAERGAVLRDWYMSQFYPVTSTMDLDGMMGFRATPADEASAVESNRLVAFRAVDPASPPANAAMARWFQAKGDLQFALELLDGVLAERPEEARRDPFFVGTLVDVLVDLGEMERAGAEFDAWPEGDRSRGYWLARGRVAQEVRDDPAVGAEAFDEALGMWPGPIDWRSMHRAATCRARAGDRDRAAELRSRAGELETLMDEKVHARLRRALVTLDNRESLGDLVDFYRKIDRPREAEAWSRFIDGLGDGAVGERDAASGGAGSNDEHPRGGVSLRGRNPGSESSNARGIRWLAGWR